MCFHRVECWKFYPSPFNKASCCIYCKRNPDVVNEDYAFDYYNPKKGEKIFRAPLIPRVTEEGVEKTGEATIRDDFSEVDAFINQMDKTSRASKIVSSPVDLSISIYSTTNTNVPALGSALNLAETDLPVKVAR